MSFQPSPPDISPPVNQGREGFRRRGLPQIAGYEIDREIGRGGMATVYRATQQSLQRQVAIKVLVQELDDSSEMAQRFKKEGHILARLLHPNIVTIYDVGITENNQIYLSIEYLSGGTLRERIRQGLSLDSAIYIARCMAKALGYAHSKGIIHRDIKPSNIMFRYDGTPVLADFGVARFSGSNTIQTAVGLMVGSPGYMSPEQAKGESATIQSDLYGLGVVLYEMLTGKLLYQADNPLAVMLMHLHDLVPNLPNEYAYLQPILNKLLAKKSIDRYQNADQFLKALNLIIPSDTGSQTGWNTGSHNQGLIDFASGTLQSLFKKKSQRQIWIGVVSIVILAIATGYFFRSKPAPESTTTSSESLKRVEKKLPLPREEEIAVLLKEADAQLQAGLSNDEAEQNVETAYRQVLRLDRGNAQALTGLQNMVKEYLRLARQKLESGSPYDGLEQVKKGLALAPDNTDLIKLRQEAEQKLVELKARKAELNQQQELQLQADQLLMQAQSNFKEGLFEISLAHIEQGLLAVPDHRELLALREQVKMKRADQQRQMEEQQRAEEAARQKEEEEKQQKIEQVRRQKEAVQYLSQALEMQKNGKYVDSLQQIEQGLKLVPNDPKLIKLLDQVRTQQMTEQQQQAEEIRRNQEMRKLLDQAEIHFKARRFTGPEGNNAEATYRQLLKFDPDNTEAKAGLMKIALDYLQQARQRRDAGALTSSLELINKGLAVVPNQTELTQLREEVSREIGEAEAQQQREKEQQAKAEQLLAQAQRSVQENQLETGLAHIEQGLLAVPDHRELLALREQVKAKKIEQQKQAEARQKAEEAARQKAAEVERQKAEQMLRQQEADQYLMQALDLQKNGHYADGLQKTQKGLVLVPDHPDLVRLRDQIRIQQVAEQKQQAEKVKRDEKIQKLLDRAEAQFKAKRLTEPAGNNAEATYQQLLKIDQGNTKALAGLDNIAQDYLHQAQASQAKGALQDSLKLIEKGLAVIPNQVDLVKFREEIRTQLAIEQQKQDQQRLEEKQRQEAEKLRREQQKKLEQSQPDKNQQEEKQRQEQQRKDQQRLGQQRKKAEQQRKDQQRLEQQQKKAEQQRKDQQRQEEKQSQHQQKKMEQQRLEQQRKDQQRLEQQQKFEQQRLEQQRLEQQRKQEQQRQEQQRKELPPEKQATPETMTKPRVFGTF